MLTISSKRCEPPQAALLDELDAEFGVGALLADEQRASRARAYRPPALRGLRVAHDLAAVSAAWSHAWRSPRAPISICSRSV